MSVQRIGVVLATAATVAAFGLCATRDFARSTPTIDPAPDTPLGRITAHTIGRIIPTSDLSFNMFFPRVERLAGGEWVVSGDEGAGHIQVFRSINSAPQKVGRAGGGPGEFDSPRQVLPDSAGGMLVFDEVALRFTRFDSNLQFVESFHHTHPFPWDIVQRSRDTLFINAMDWTQEGIGYNLFVGVPGKDFFPVGSKDLTYLPGESAKFGMPIVAGDAGTIWGAPSTRHRLLQFGREGELVDSLDLGSSWFAAWTGSRGGFDTEYPRPYVVDLHRDKAGHLWILTHVAAAGWKPPRLPWLSRAKSGEGRPRLKPLEREAYLASVIEVVDPDRREVLAAIRLEPLFAGFASDGTLYRLTEDAPDGGFAIELTAVRYDPGQQGLANTGREH